MHQVGKSRLAGVCQFVVHPWDFSYSIGALSRGLFADLRALLGVATIFAPVSAGCAPILPPLHSYGLSLGV